MTQYRNTKPSLHEDELDFIMELVSFLKPFRSLPDSFSLPTPTLSAGSLIKMHIQKICAVSANDDDKIKHIKQAVLEKLNDRFPISDSVKLHQLLDPDTKNLIPHAEGSALLEPAMQDASDRGFISVIPYSCAYSSTTESDVEQPQLKHLRMKMELMEELRTESQPRQDVTNEVITLHVYCLVCYLIYCSAAFLRKFYVFCCCQHVHLTGVH